VIQHQSLDGLYHAASEPIDKHSLLIWLRDALGWDDVLITPDDSFFCGRTLVARRFRNAAGYRPPPWQHVIETPTTVRLLHASWWRAAT